MMLKRMLYARQADTNDQLSVSAPVPATMRGICKREAGTLRLKMPKLRSVPFETAIIERYRRRESSVEEALVEMYLAGVSVRRVEDITEALWGSRVSPSTVSDLNQKIFKRVEEWRNRPISEEYPYVYFDGIWLKRAWGFRSPKRFGIGSHRCKSAGLPRGIGCCRRLPRGQGKLA